MHFLKNQSLIRTYFILITFCTFRLFQSFPTFRLWCSSRATWRGRPTHRRSWTYPSRKSILSILIVLWRLCIVQAAVARLMPFAEVPSSRFLCYRTRRPRGICTASLYFQLKPKKNNIIQTQTKFAQRTFLPIRLLYKLTSAICVFSCSTSSVVALSSPCAFLLRSFDVFSWFFSTLSRNRLAKLLPHLRLSPQPPHLKVPPGGSPGWLAHVQ